MSSHVILMPTPAKLDPLARSNYTAHGQDFDSPVQIISTVHVDTLCKDTGTLNLPCWPCSGAPLPHLVEYQVALPLHYNHNHWGSGLWGVWLFPPVGPIWYPQRKFQAGVLCHVLAPGISSEQNVWALERGAIKLIWCCKLSWSVCFTLIMISAIHAYHDHSPSHLSWSLPFTLILIIVINAHHDKFHSCSSWSVSITCDR
jgi:hypothetical protein